MNAKYPCHLADAYHILGIAPGADEQTIKRAYRRLAKQYHPDVNPNDTAAHKRFRNIQSAYDLLREERRITGAEADRWSPGADGGPFMSDDSHPFFGFYEALRRSGMLK